MHKWLKRMEKTTANAVFRALKKEKKSLQDLLRQLGESVNEKKGIILPPDFGNGPVEAFLPKVKETIKRGSFDIEKKHSDKVPETFSIDFSIATHPESEYYESLRGVHLSNYKGSISETTRSRVRDAVVQGVKEGMSYGQIADNIEELDSHVFSRNRAELIAVHQIGKAYQFGEYTTMQSLWSAGYLIMKYWSTVNDNRVTPSHTRNQNNGWISFDSKFTGTNDLMPPASDNPRCRCANQYEVGDRRGGEQNDAMKSILASAEHSKKTTQYLQDLEQHYSYDKDVVMQSMNSQFSGSGAEVLYTLGDGITEEEAIALSWYKGSEYYNMNTDLRKFKTVTDQSGMIIALNSLLEKQKSYNGIVWRGVSGEASKQITNLKQGYILSDAGFISSSTERSVAERFVEDGVLIQITSKTGKILGNLDLMNEGEILFSPGTNLLLDKVEDNIYYFTEI